MELLERFKLDDKKDDFAASLSGGQRKLLEMARALMSDPTLVMLDEPMAGVNPALTQSLLDHILDLKDEGMTVLFVEHDMHMVRHIADWVDRHGRGQDRRRGRPPHGHAEPRRHRRLPRRAPGHRPRRDRLPEQVEATEGAASMTNSESRQRRARSREPTATEELVVDVRNVAAGYLPGVNILNGCSLTARQGELIGIIGPNGAGKSTLLKAIFGLVKVREGAILLQRRRHHGPQGEQARRARASASCRRTTTCSRASRSKRTSRWASTRSPRASRSGSSS